MGAGGVICHVKWAKPVAVKDHKPGDALLVSAIESGLQSVCWNVSRLRARLTCEEEDSADELYRFLLFTVIVRVSLGESGTAHR